VAICTTDGRFLTWAEGRSIPHFDSLARLASFIEEHPIDYLFSIVNYSIVPGALLKAPRRLAINYHDALLPRYAGTYSTTWAILNGENVHGISWHVMVEDVDAGDVLKQVKIPIADNDTALTLNYKCFGEAARSFSGLIEDLETGVITAQKQDLTERTYFEFCHRPPGACLIPFDSTAREINSFCRALDFGNYANPIGVPKLAIGEGFFAVAGTEVTSVPSQMTPGSVAGIDGECLTLASRTYDVRLKGITTLGGAEMTPGKLADRFNISTGVILNAIEAPRMTRIGSLHRRTCTHERFWLQQLVRLRPAEVPGAQAAGAPAHSWQVLAVHPGCRPLDALAQLPGLGRAADVLLCLHAIFLGRLSCGPSDFGYADTGLTAEVTGIEELFAACVPARFAVDASLDALLSGLERLRKGITYMRDIGIRHPGSGLHDPMGDSGAGSLTSYPIVLRLFGPRSRPDERLGTQLTVNIGSDGVSCLWVYNNLVIREDVAERLRSEFEMFLSQAVRSLLRNEAERLA